MGGMSTNGNPNDLAGSVSVVTPTFNAAQVLTEAIRSVCAQTVPVLEHIVIDDGSTDATREVVEELQRTVPHLVYIRRPRENAAAARNAGIEAARGTYIAFLDSDDFWLPRKIERQLGFMRTRDCVFSYGSYVVRHRISGKTLRTHQPPAMVGYRDLLRSCPVGCLTAAYNQEALGKRYMPAVARGQDWGLWLALTRNGVRGMRYPGVEAVYVCGGESLSANKLSKGRDMYRIYRQYERFGRLRAFWHLARHSFYALGDGFP